MNHNLKIHTMLQDVEEPPDDVNATVTPPYRGTKEVNLYLPIYVMTGIFGAIFILGPIIVRKRPNKALLRWCIMLTTFWLWLFTVTVYIAQMNPLLAPRIKNTTLIWLIDPNLQKEPEPTTPPAPAEEAARRFYLLNNETNDNIKTLRPYNATTITATAQAQSSVKFQQDGSKGRRFARKDNTNLPEPTVTSPEITVNCSSTVTFQDVLEQATRKVDVTLQDKTVSSVKNN